METMAGRGWVQVMDRRGLEEPATKSMGLKEELASENLGRKEEAVRTGTAPGRGPNWSSWRKKVVLGKAHNDFKGGK